MRTRLYEYFCDIIASLYLPCYYGLASLRSKKRNAGAWLSRCVHSGRVRITWSSASRRGRSSICYGCPQRTKERTSLVRYQPPDMLEHIRDDACRGVVKYICYSGMHGVFRPSSASQANARRLPRPTALSRCVDCAAAGLPLCGLSRKCRASPRPAPLGTPSAPARRCARASSAPDG